MKPKNKDLNKTFQKEKNLKFKFSLKHFKLFLHTKILNKNKNKSFRIILFNTKQNIKINKIKLTKIILSSLKINIL
jgi:hypothetical protein